MKVFLGRKYRLEATTDLKTWNPVGDAFVAQDEELVQEFDVDTTVVTSESLRFLEATVPPIKRYQYPESLHCHETWKSNHRTHSNAIPLS